MKPDLEVSNPVSDTVEGQKALLEATSIIRDLTLALNRVYENIRDAQGIRRLNVDLSKNFKERVETFRNYRNTIKKVLFYIKRVFNSTKPKQSPGFPILGF